MILTDAYRYRAALLAGMAFSMPATAGSAEGLPWGLYSDKSTSIAIPFASPIIWKAKDEFGNNSPGATLSVGIDGMSPSNFMLDTG